MYVRTNYFVLNYISQLRNFMILLLQCKNVKFQVTEYIIIVKILRVCQSKNFLPHFLEKEKLIKFKMQLYYAHLIFTYTLTMNI